MTTTAPGETNTYCSVCNRRFRRNYDGTVTVHGPRNNRCPGSRK